MCTTWVDGIKYAAVSAHQTGKCLCLCVFVIMIIINYNPKPTFYTCWKEIKLTAAYLEQYWQLLDAIKILSACFFRSTETLAAYTISKNGWRSNQQNARNFRKDN